MATSNICTATWAAVVAKVKSVKEGLHFAVNSVRLCEAKKGTVAVSVVDVSIQQTMADMLRKASGVDGIFTKSCVYYYNSKERLNERKLRSPSPEVKDGKSAWTAQAALVQLNMIQGNH